MEEQSIPNPGSDEALRQGCTCPVLDNGHGDEELGRIRGFWINAECPLHGVKNTLEGAVNAVVSE